VSRYGLILANVVGFSTGVQGGGQIYASFAGAGWSLAYSVRFLPACLPVSNYLTVYCCLCGAATVLQRIITPVLIFHRFTAGAGLLQHRTRISPPPNRNRNLHHRRHTAGGGLLQHQPHISTDPTPATGACQAATQPAGSAVEVAPHVVQMVCVCV
jgi:hypothetical protein